MTGSAEIFSHLGGIILGEHAHDPGAPVLQGLEPISASPFQFTAVKSIKEGYSIYIPDDYDLLEMKKAKAQLCGTVSFARVGGEKQGIPQAKKAQCIEKAEKERIVNLWPTDYGVGWYPRYIGDSLSLTARADNFVPYGDLHWRFLKGTLPKRGRTLHAMLDCPGDDDQDLTMDYALNRLGLAGANSFVDLSHLVNNELQDLVFNDSTNELSITPSATAVDLSHLANPTQELKWDNKTMKLGLSGSQGTVDLSPLVQSLSIDTGKNNILEISGNGTGVDLSEIRIVSLQGSIENVNGKETKERMLGEKVTKVYLKMLVAENGASEDQKERGQED